jgi:hypothetical protein
MVTTQSANFNLSKNTTYIVIHATLQKHLNGKEKVWLVIKAFRITFKQNFFDQDEGLKFWLDFYPNFG